MDPDFIQDLSKTVPQTEDNVSLVEIKILINFSFMKLKSQNVSIQLLSALTCPLPSLPSPLLPQLTETSSRYARKISGTTALQEALKEKQQHIEQLLAERDLERAEMAKATSHICEVEKELGAIKAQHVQVRERGSRTGGGARRGGAEL